MGGDGHICDYGSPNAEPGDRCTVVDHGHTSASDRNPTRTTFTKQNDGSWQQTSSSGGSGSSGSSSSK